MSRTFLKSWASYGPMGEQNTPMSVTSLPSGGEKFLPSQDLPSQAPVDPGLWAGTLITRNARWRGSRLHLLDRSVIFVARGPFETIKHQSLSLLKTPPADLLTLQIKSQFLTLAFQDQPLRIAPCPLRGRTSAAALTCRCSSVLCLPDGASAPPGPGLSCSVHD